MDSIKIHYCSYDTRSYIYIELSHGGRGYRNSINIRGIDTKWVNGKLRNLEEIINSFKPQNTLITRYKKFIHSIAALGIGALYIYFISFFPSDPTRKPPGWIDNLINIDKVINFIMALPLPVVHLGFYLFKYFLAYLAGYIPAWSLVNKLKELFPSVEIQIGPEHTFIERQRRKWLFNAFVLCILP